MPLASIMTTAASSDARSGLTNPFARSWTMLAHAGRFPAPQHDPPVKTFEGVYKKFATYEDVSGVVMQVPANRDANDTAAGTARIFLLFTGTLAVVIISSQRCALQQTCSAWNLHEIKQNDSLPPQESGISAHSTFDDLKIGNFVFDLHRAEDCSKRET